MQPRLQFVNLCELEPLWCLTKSTFYFLKELDIVFSLICSVDRIVFTDQISAFAWWGTVTPCCRAKPPPISFHSLRCKSELASLGHERLTTNKSEDLGVFCLGGLLMTFTPCSCMTINMILSLIIQSWPRGRPHHVTTTSPLHVTSAHLRVASPSASYFSDSVTASKGLSTHIRAEPGPSGRDPASSRSWLIPMRWEADVALMLLCLWFLQGTRRHSSAMRSSKQR